jgi:VIT1/CCC1 family predicted Fe2+/Mn2+ transporter
MSVSPSDPSTSPHSEVVKELRADHTPARVRERLAAGPQRSYLRDAVYGAVDGAITTMAVVSGSTGADLGAGIVLILGFANLAGDGFSMAIGNVLGTRAEAQQLVNARESERQQIHLHPDGEREEVRQLLAARGLAGDVLERAVEAITEDEEGWIDLMVTDELGLSLHPPSAWRAGLTTFVAFVLAGLVPLLPFVVERLGVTIASPIVWSVAMTGVTFVAIGAIKARFVLQPVWRAAAETVLLGGTAAFLAYGVGVALGGLVG